MAAAAAARLATFGVGVTPTTRGAGGADAPPGLVRLDRVKEEPRPWLWPGRLPAGELVALVGDPMAGKSGVTFSLAARVTTGLPWPDGADNVAGNVLFLSAEDSVACTLRPRLRAEGARVRRVHAFTGALDLSTAVGLSVLEARVAEIGGVRLVVIDPLTAYLPTLNTHSEANVRRVMTALRGVAERHRATVVVVLHLGKAGGRKAMQRPLGSVAFTGVPRVVYAVGADPAGGDFRLLVPVKFSFGAMPPGIRFRVVDYAETPARASCDSSRTTCG